MYRKQNKAGVSLPKMKTFEPPILHEPKYHQIQKHYSNKNIPKQIPPQYFSIDSLTLWNDNPQSIPPIRKPTEPQTSINTVQILDDAYIKKKTSNLQIQNKYNSTQNTPPLMQPFSSKPIFDKQTQIYKVKSQTQRSQLKDYSHAPSSQTLRKKDSAKKFEEFVSKAYPLSQRKQNFLKKQEKRKEDFYSEQKVDNNKKLPQIPFPEREILQINLKNQDTVLTIKKSQMPYPKNKANQQLPSLTNQNTNSINKSQYSNYRVPQTKKEIIPKKISKQSSDNSKNEEEFPCKIEIELKEPQLSSRYNEIFNEDEFFDDYLSKANFLQEEKNEKKKQKIKVKQLQRKENKGKSSSKKLQKIKKKSKSRMQAIPIKSQTWDPTEMIPINETSLDAYNMDNLFHIYLESQIKKAFQ